MEDGASPNYFRTMGIPIIAGREFEERDRGGASKLVVVNEAFVKRFARAGNLLGKHIAFSTGNVVPDFEIIGIVRDSKYVSLRDEPRPFVWWGFAQEDRLNGATFYVRALRDGNPLGSDVRRLIRNLDANLPVYEMQSMQVRVEESIYHDRMIATLASAFGALATLLAAIGLYGVVAFNVARRTSEMGVRMALGARQHDVLSMVMREVGWMVASGSVIGLAAAWLLGRYVQSQLYGVTAKDPMVFGGAAVVLITIAMVAGFIPARRASRVDPMVALRCE
jgi:predicted permease